MHWPDRWRQLDEKFLGTGNHAADQKATPPRTESDLRSKDFLAIVGDPLRVGIDWQEHHTQRVRASDRATTITQGEIDAQPSPVLDSRNQRNRRPNQPQPRQEERLTSVDLARPAENLTAEDRGRPYKYYYTPPSPDAPVGEEAVLLIAPDTFIDAALSGWEKTGDPHQSSQLPAVLRLSPKLRSQLMRAIAPQIESAQRYTSRVLWALRPLVENHWLDFQETRDAMKAQGWSIVRGTRSGGLYYVGHTPITDPAQIQPVDFFGDAGVLLPNDWIQWIADLYSKRTRGTLTIAPVADAPHVRALDQILAEDRGLGQPAARQRLTAIRRNLTIAAKQAR